MIVFTKGFNLHTGLKSGTIKQWIKAELRKEQKQIQHIQINLISDHELLHINQTYLNHDYYTDIITFDYSDSHYVTGELFISKDRVKENAQKNKITSQQEYARVIIHGILHLCAYSDQTPSNKRKMRKRENIALHSLSLLAD
jgi:probable rRNA maturation factor